jgi:hypothetical protein
MTRGTQWTDAEIDLMRRLMAVDASPDTMARQLGRSVFACRGKRLQLKADYKKPQATDPYRGPSFFRESPPKADHAKHLRLILKHHGGGFPWKAARS